MVKIKVEVNMENEKEAAEVNMECENKWGKKGQDTFG